MPSKPPETLSYAAADKYSGRCYCGVTTLVAKSPAQTVTYCHCSDCRRITGAPVAAFAAFASNEVTITPDPGPVSANPGVERWFCRTCGSPMAARFTYLPGQVYVPIGVLDQAADLAPQQHSHAEACLPWLHIDDNLERFAASGRAALQAVRATSGDPE